MALVGCLALFASLGVVGRGRHRGLQADRGPDRHDRVRARAPERHLLPGRRPARGWLQQIAEILPFTWGFDVVRASLLGGDVHAARLAGLYGSALVLLPIAVFAFTIAVGRARRTGTLAQY